MSSRLKLLAFFFVPVLILFGVGLALGPLGSSFMGKEPPEILKVPRPYIHLPAETVAHVGDFSITNTLIASWFTILLLVGLSVLLTRKMNLIPGRRQGLGEVVVEELLNFVESISGAKHARMLFSGVATIFIYVIFNAYLPLLPFFGTIGFYHSAHGHEEFIAIFRAANTDVNLPLSIAIMSFIFVETWGMRASGVLHYLSEFINVRQFLQGLKELFTGKIRTGPMNIIFGFISLFVGVLEIFSHLTRMVSFTFRLFGNMTAGKILILVSCFLVPFVFTIPFYGLELLIGLIQALIFAGLTLVFGTVATSPAHEESEQK
ncbi:MAG: F0F1 ATP synthase subunit A [Deltaproteobacteria bacterium]|nr:F0F1 ATP synthase subunit A [Deltaproteobacteria bacterium]MBM4323175.1 F0F1 ATP synthase subunit A [Deltaproteobacteria bacterium]